MNKCSYDYYLTIHKSKRGKYSVHHSYDRPYQRAGYNYELIAYWKMPSYRFMSNLKAKLIKFICDCPEDLSLFLLLCPAGLNRVSNRLTNTINTIESQRREAPQQGVGVLELKKFWKLREVGNLTRRPGEVATCVNPGKS